MTNGLGWAGGNLWIVEESRFCLTRIAEYSPRLSGEVGKDWSQLKRFYPGQGLPGQVWSSGKVQWITDLTLTDIYPRAGEAAQVGLHTVCGSPFLLDGKVSGVFECFHQDVLEPDKDMLETLVVVGAMLGQLLQRRRDEVALRKANTRLRQAYEREREIALRFQKSLWPSTESRLSGYDAAFSYRPAFKDADVGGDFFNLFDIDSEKVGLVIGDVGGKGLEAAVTAAWVQHALVALALRAEANPGLVLDDLQRLLGSLQVECLVTIFFALLEKKSGRMVYSCAGHEPALIWSGESSSCRQLEYGQPALVGFPVDPYRCYETKLDRGEILFLYTDGLSESGTSVSQMLGQDGIADLLAYCRGKKPSEILKFFCQAAAGISHGHLKDDIAMVALQRHADDRDVGEKPVELCDCEIDDRD
ncbi:MAG: SpoIIE family protein phosphatase [Candidatus Eremiobacteraeota bacterium]|nr:SpoIIE family protein phosphatase [Candidatus Eremiobacteraeota bacterium]